MIWHAIHHNTVITNYYLETLNDNEFNYTELTIPVLDNPSSTGTACTAFAMDYQCYGTNIINIVQEEFLKDKVFLTVCSRLKILLEHT